MCVGATPTLLDLMAMKGADGEPLRIIETIAAGNYKMFGMYLLRDKNGTMVDLIEKDHIIRGAASVTQAILQKWLTSDAPTHTCTYQHLIECLRQSELGALAELIENTTQRYDTITHSLTRSSLSQIKLFSVRSLHCIPAGLLAVLMCDNCCPCN